MTSLPNCPNCGYQLPEGSRFCPNCGAPQAQVPPAYYPPPARKSSVPIIVVVLVAVVVITVLLVGVGVLFVFSERSSGQVDMAASTFGSYTDNFTSERPGDGREWVVVNVTVWNNRSYDIPIVWAFFTLSTTGNATDSVAVFSLEGYYHPPATVPSGESRSFPIVFDIPAGSTPVVLKYDGYIAQSTCPLI